MPQPPLGSFYWSNPNVICNQRYGAGYGSVKVANTNTPNTIQFKCGNAAVSAETVSTYQFSCLSSADTPRDAQVYVKISRGEKSGFDNAHCITVYEIQSKEIKAGDRGCVPSTQRTYTLAKGNSIQMWAVKAHKKNAVLSRIGVYKLKQARFYAPIYDDVAVLSDTYEVSHTFPEDFNDRDLSYCGEAPADSDVTLYTAVYTAAPAA